MHWPTLRLGEIFEIARGGSPRPIEQFVTTAANGLNWIKIGDATGGGKYIRSTKEKIKPEGLNKTRFVNAGDFLLTNSMSFGRPYILATDGCIHDGWLVLRPQDRSTIDQDYFYHVLSSDAIYQEFAARAGGSTVKNLNTEIVASVEIALPPLDEQRRIAAILDKADALRRKRKRALDLLDSLTRSVFLEMFGNIEQCSTIPFGRALGEPLRNGLSPSKAGTYAGKVLTLSAITSGVFEPRAMKEAMFDHEPPLSQRVEQGAFFVCRGNGNKSLVGLGVFSSTSIPDTAFPDTIIAGRVDISKFDHRYFQSVWNSPCVRSQIERSARTTNGTFKINQATLEAIEIPAPKLTQQKKYGQHLDMLDTKRVQFQDQLASLDTLFASLQSRAFSGQL